MTAALESFSPATREWFAGAFAAPTAAQEGAWSAAQQGKHALVVAPTGSGKTLSAFLWALDRLASGPPPASPQHRCRVLYVSPLKALAVDVQRNLRSPLAGIRHAAQRLGLPFPDITVGMRTGDTPADERRQFARTPPDVLVTTPGVAVPAPHVGRSRVAARRPHGDPRRGARRRGHQARRASGAVPGAARRAAGAARRSGSGCRPPSGRSTRCPRSSRAPAPSRSCSRARRRPSRCRSRFQCPISRALDERPAPGSSDEEVVGSAAGTAQRPSIWPAVERRLLELVRTHRSTIVFANSRRLAERLTSRLNELAAEEVEGVQDLDGAFPAEAIGQSGIGGGAPAAVGEGPPRLDVARAAHARGGGAEGRGAALRRGDVQPGAGHRHGRGRSRRASGGAAERGVGAAAGGPRGPPGGRGVQRRGVPEVPGRSRRVRGGRGADDGRRDRVPALPAQPARRAGPAHRGHGRAGAVVARRPGPRGAAGRAVRRAAGVGAARRARHAGRAATRPRSSASSGPASPGTASPTSSAAGPVRSGWPSPPAARFPIAACSRS